MGKTNCRCGLDWALGVEPLVQKVKADRAAYPAVETGSFREAAAPSITGEMGTTDQPAGLTRKGLGLRAGALVQDVRVKLNRCFGGSRLGEATGVTLTGFSFEGEKPRVAFKQPNDSVILGSLHPEAGCGSGFLWG